MLYNWLKPVAFIALGSIIGVFFCNFEYFKLDPTIEIGDIFCLSITTIIGLYIAQTIHKQQNSDRKEKDFIIDEVQNLRKDFGLIINYNDSGTYPFELTKATIKTINKKIIQIQVLIELSTYCKNANIGEIHVAFKSLRRMILQISPVNDNIILSQRQKAQAETKLNLIIQNTYKLILNINNS